MVKTISIEYKTRYGVTVRETYTLESAIKRLAQLVAMEEETRRVAPTDSGDVRFNYHSEERALRAALPGHSLV